MVTHLEYALAAECLVITAYPAYIDITCMLVLGKRYGYNRECAVLICVCGAVILVEQEMSLTARIEVNSQDIGGVLIDVMDISARNQYGTRRNEQRNTLVGCIGLNGPGIPSVKVRTYTGPICCVQWNPRCNP